MIFADWYFSDELELWIGFDYELEHPGWVCEWEPRMAREFPGFTVGE